MASDAGFLQDPPARQLRFVVAGLVVHLGAPGCCTLGVAAAWAADVSNGGGLSSREGNSGCCGRRLWGQQHGRAMVAAATIGGGLGANNMDSRRMQQLLQAAALGPAAWAGRRWQQQLQAAALGAATHALVATDAGRGSSVGTLVAAA